MRHSCLTSSRAALAAACVLLLAAEAGAATPTPPVPSATLSGDGFVAIAWERGENESPSSCDITSYWIYRTTITGEWTHAGTVMVNCVMPYCNSDTRSFMDGDLTNGVWYSYVVEAMPSSGTDGGYSSTMWVKAGDPYEKPNGPVDAESGDGWVRLGWESGQCPGPWTDAYATGYVIFRATSSIMIPHVNQLASITRLSGYTDYTVTNLRPYQYLVYPCCPLGAGMNISATPYRALAAGGQPTAVVDPSGPRAVRVSWPAAPPPLLSQSYPLNGYQVFRSDDGGGTMTKVADVPVSKLFIIDTVPSYGKRYVYLVRPVDSQGNLGNAYPLAVMDIVLPSNRLFLNHNRFYPGKGEKLDVIFQITEPGRVRIHVMSLTGELVKKLYDNEHSGQFSADSPLNSRYAGLPPVTWNGTNEGGELVGSGAYMVILELNRQRDIRTVAVIR